MNILGVNAGRAAPPAHDPSLRRPLADGSAALLQNGIAACATIEERHARVRYAGGFARAAAACLSAAGIEIRDVDAIGLSTCCDSRWECENDRIDAVLEELPDDRLDSNLQRHLSGRVHCIDHHDSHAMLAFAGSDFQRCLVFVVDGFGNRIDGAGTFHPDAAWWRGHFDRQTVYLAQWRDGFASLERIHEGAAGIDDVGIAELYRSVTHFLGWPSYQFAGKTMALSAYGDPNALENLTLIDCGQDGAPRVHLRNRHDDPIGQIADAISGAGYILPESILRPATPANHVLADVAAVVQNQVERTLIEWVSSFSDRFGVAHVAISGGLALNCVAMGKLAAARPDLSVYVPSAPGDTGQGLGNALWLAHAEASPIRQRRRVNSIRSAALGPPLRAQSIHAAVGRLQEGKSRIDVYRPADSDALASSVVAALRAGKAVAVRQGRSEYGPRALGQCSILFDPSLSDARIRVNAIKRREEFRPFAASVLAPFEKDCFDFAGRSPFMSFAAPAREAVRRGAPGVVHVDGTTRIQSVASNQGLLAKVLAEFHQHSGLPLLLNTSFNLAGEPIVESPDEAISVFKRSPIDALALGPYFLHRR